VPFYSPRYRTLAIFPLKDFFFLQVMSIPLFPEATGFVEECQTSVGFVLEDSISQHKLFELAIHVQGTFSSFSSRKVQFCKLLSRMLKNVPTEDGPMEVMWMRVLRMLKTYRESVGTAKKKRQFVWSSEYKIIMKLRQQLEAPFQIDPPQVLVISNALPL
jgi:hypothetical protein